MIIGLDEFANGDPLQIYARMRPDQRTAVANEFVRMLFLRCDEAAARFRYSAHDPLATSGAPADAPEPGPGKDTVVPVRPELLTAEQAAEIHLYAQQRCPDAFEAVARHPVTMAALAWPGAAAEEPAARALGAHEAGTLPCKPSPDELAATGQVSTADLENCEEARTEVNNKLGGVVTDIDGPKYRRQAI
jgi:hypothetical protein